MWEVAECAASKPLASKSRPHCPYPTSGVHEIDAFTKGIAQLLVSLCLCVLHSTEREREAHRQFDSSHFWGLVVLARKAARSGSQPAALLCPLRKATLNTCLFAPRHCAEADNCRSHQKHTGQQQSGSQHDKAQRHTLTTHVGPAGGSSV